MSPVLHIVASAKVDDMAVREKSYKSVAWPDHAEAADESSR